MRLSGHALTARYNMAYMVKEDWPDGKDIL